MEQNPYQSPESLPEVPPPPAPYSFEKKLFWGFLYAVGSVVQGYITWLIIDKLQ